MQRHANDRHRRSPHSGKGSATSRQIASAVIAIAALGAHLLAGAVQLQAVARGQLRSTKSTAAYLQMAVQYPRLAYPEGDESRVAGDEP